MATIVGDKVKLSSGKLIAPQTGAWYDSQQYWGGTLSQPGQINPLSNQPGAGQQVSQEVVQQSGIYNANWTYIQQQNQKPTTQDQVTPYLNDYQSGIYNAQEAPAVRSVGEIAEEVKGFLPAGGPPTPPSMLETYQKMREERGIDALEASINDIKAQIEEEYAILRQQRGIEEGKPVPMGVISGRISEEERTAMERVDFLGRQQNRMVDEYTSAMGAIQVVMDLTGQDYQMSKDAYDTAFTQALNLYNVVRDVQESEKTDLQRAQDNARANLQVMVNAITSGNLNYDTAPMEYKMQIAKMEAMSGLPIGFTSSLGMSAKDQLITYNEKTGEALMMRSGGGFEVIQTGMRPSPTTGAGAGTSESTRENFLAEAGTIQGRDIGGTWVGEFPLLVQKYAPLMSLEEIYRVYMDSDLGKKYGAPSEDPAEIKRIYDRARGKEGD